MIRMLAKGGHSFCAAAPSICWHQLWHACSTSRNTMMLMGMIFHWGYHQLYVERHTWLLACQQQGNIIAPPAQPPHPTCHPATPPIPKIALFRSKQSPRETGGKICMCFSTPLCPTTASARLTRYPLRQPPYTSVYA